MIAFQAEKRVSDGWQADKNVAGHTTGLSPLKWATMVVPGLILIAFDFVRHNVLPFSFLHGWSGLLIVWSLALAGVVVFSQAVFAIIGKMERDRLRHFEDQVRRSKEFAVLNTISNAVSSSLDLKAVMVAAIDRLMDLMEAEAGEIWLLDESGQELTLAIHLGVFPRCFHEVERFAVGKGLPGLVTQTGEPIISQNLSSDELLLRPSVQDEGFQFLACLPLKSKGRVVGTMSLGSLRSHDLSAQDIQLLVSSCNQIGVAIENATLHRQIQHMAILEERERIAREMHDGVAQVLGYVNAKTLTAKRLLSVGKISQAEEALEQLDEAAREVYADVREAILGLRATMLPSRGLTPTVREYSEWFSRQNMIQVELTVEGPCDEEIERATEVQLIRIVQEALNNVRKHANAQRAWVQLCATNGQVHLTVRDDGHGFDPERVARGRWPQFGLQTMRERAESIGGTFAVSSAPGRGTVVRVELPKGACLP